MAFAGIVGLLLFAAAGPLATDDLWWHLSLGRLYATAGPWLDVDTRLHTALAPPRPNAWLFDLVLSQIAERGGLGALRAFHALTVGSILALVWLLLHRASRSAWLASSGAALFAALSAYRLLQLRPSLFTILACAALLLLVMGSDRVLSGRRIALAALVCALWANCHPGFVLGPALLAVAAAAAALSGLLAGWSGRWTPESRTQALRLAGTCVLATLASGLNPDGFAAHARYFGAGVESASSAFIVDEWRAFDAFSLPQRNLPATPAAWVGFWALLLATPWVTARTLALAIRRRASAADPALLALALVGLIAPFIAVRFLWLSLLPLLWIAACWRLHPIDPRRAAPAAAVVCLALLAATHQASGWRILAPRFDRDSYSRHYDADRYYAHALWFLMDSGVEGNLFHPYFMGGFAGYWLAPGLRTMVDGSLNFPTGTLEDYTRIMTRQRGMDESDPAALLDRYEIDFFVGVGLPIQPAPGRPWRYSTSHLERSPDWILVYRGLRSAVYMRRDPRNAPNLSRIARAYAAARVPFDPVTGFDVARVLDDAIGWAVEHGVAPIDYPDLLAATKRPAAGLRHRARDRLAWTHAVLGLYGSSLEIDAADQRERPGLSPDGARERRRVWNWLRLDRGDRALEEVGRWIARDGEDPLVRQLQEAATHYLQTEDPSERNRLAAMMTPFTRREGGRIKAVELPSPSRSRREQG